MFLQGVYIVVPHSLLQDPPQQQHCGCHLGLSAREHHNVSTLSCPHVGSSSHGFSLTEMCVGVTVSCMPSLVKFVQHHFPDFSVVHSFLSFKSLVLKTCDGKTRALPLGSGSQDHVVQNPRFSESETIRKRPGAHLDMNDLELGKVSQITACDDGNVAVAMDDMDGIRIGQGWEQTSRKRG